MASGALSIKLRCASWQQLATIYKRDLMHGTMFLKASTPPAVNTHVRIDLTLPSGTVDLVMPVTWFLWPPGVEMWANAAVATDVLHITELPLPENFVGVAVGLTVAS